MIRNSTEILADYIAELKFGDLPGEAVHQAKLVILDVLGSGIGAFQFPLAKVVIDVMKGLGGKPESTIFGDGSKVSCPGAGFVNAILAEEIEYVNHFHTPLVPAALAVSESIHASGKNVITSVVAGYEVLTRINRSMNPSENAFPPGHRPWWLGTFGSFASATAAGKVLALNKEEMSYALGYLGVAAPVPMRDAPYDGRPEGRVNWGIHAVYGPSTYSGIIAALLARRGYRGNSTVFDDPKGFWITAATDRCDFDELTRNLGSEYTIIETFFKRYPHCGQMASILYALTAIHRENKIHAEEIDQIIVRVPKEVPMPLVPYFEHYEPEYLYDAQFSVPCGFANLLLEEPPYVRWYMENRFRDPELLVLASKVKMKADPEADRVYRETGQYMNTVEVIMRDGRRFSESSESPWAFGAKYTIQRENELIDKFRGVASYTLEEPQIDELIELTLNLEEVGDVSKLARLFAPTGV